MATSPMSIGILMSPDAALRVISAAHSSGPCFANLRICSGLRMPNSSLSVLTTEKPARVSSPRPIRGAQISDFGVRERALLLERRQQVRGQRLVLVEQPRELLLLLGAADAGMIEREPSRRRPLEVARFSDWPWESGSQ